MMKGIRMNGINRNTVATIAASVRRFLGTAILVGPATLAAANTTALPFQEIETIDPFRRTTFDVAAGQIDQTLTDFGTTMLRPAIMASVTLTGGSADPYDPASGRSTFVLVASTPPNAANYFAPKAVIGELLDPTTPGVSLVIGADTNNDGKPEAGEVICESELSASSSGRCVLGPDMLVGGSYWVMALAPNVPGASYSAKLSAGMTEVAGPQLPSDISYSAGMTSVSGPASVATGAAFRLQMTRLVPAQPLTRYYGAVLMGSGYLIFNTYAILPFALEQADASPIMIDPANGPINLSTFGTQTSIYTLFPGESHRRLFFDLPASASNYDSIVVDGRVVSGPGSTPTPNLELALVRTDFPASSPSAVVAAAPADATPAIHWNVTTNDQDVTAVLSHPQAGRWYIVATNKGSDPIAFVTNVADGSNPPNTTSGFGRGANPLLVPGNYFNPQRSGHGISISQAAGQQLLFWYTYLKDGTPVWYLAQAAAPAADSGWWASPLYQVSWDGSVGTPTQVGYVELVPTATNRLMFTWHLADASGSETFELLASGKTCVSVDGVATNFSGNWFAPSQAGYGVDVLGLPDQQFDVFYFYDAAGTGRWGIGAAPFATNSTLDMLQSSGFCPVCDYMPVTTQALGPMTINFTADASRGTFITNFTFKAPLEGTFNVHVPIIRLTGSNTCQ
jgi:hypothetical protein